MTENEDSPSPHDWPAVERRRPGWALDWQSAVERDKATLADTLHDETGGLLVAAVMDIAWAENHLESHSADARSRLARARLILDSAIELNRRIIEDLRPTLLENFELVAALKWHFAEVCNGARIHCQSELPEQILTFTPIASIALYRAAEALLSSLVSLGPSRIDLTLEIDNERMRLRVTATGLQKPYAQQTPDTSHATVSAIGRVKSLGGEFRVKAIASEVTMTCEIGLTQILENA